MKKTIASLSALLVLGATAYSAHAQDYSFPTKPMISIEISPNMSMTYGSSEFYPVVYKFSSVLPDSTMQWSLENSTGDVLPVTESGDRYTVDAAINRNDHVFLVYSGMNSPRPVRMWLTGPMDVGHINFASGSASLDSGARTILRAVARQAKDADLTSVLLVGRADSVGSVASNLSLSEKRVQAAYDYLVAEMARIGVTSMDVTMQFMGDYESTDLGGKSNPDDRRVDITLYPNM